VLVLAAILPTRADPDLWGNVRFGLDLLGTWSFSTIDRYSFTSDIPWVNHSWLPQLAMAIAYSWAGPAGLVALKTAIVGATLWLIAGAFKGSAFLVSEAAVLAVLLPGIAVFATLRAQIWTVLGLVILCRLILTGRLRPMAWVPLLFIVWVNSHVGWITGIGLLAWWAAGCLVRGPSRERYGAVAIVAVTLLATLANPYGWKMWRFLFGVAHLSRNISEWQPLVAAPLLQQAAFVACVLAVAVMARRIPFERLISIAGLAYAAVRAIKFNSVFVTVSTLFLAPAIKARFPERTNVGGPLAAPIRLVNAAVITALIAFTTCNALPRMNCLEAGDWRPDATAARALLDAAPPGRIAVAFDWGEYVIWHLGPTLRVAYDPRYDLVYSPRVIAEQDAVEKAEPEGLAFLQRTRPEYLWFRQSSVRLKSWAAGNGYRLDIDTPASFVAVREDVAPLRDPGPQTFGCFPSS
jgi:hypothetical protein